MRWRPITAISFPRITNGVVKDFTPAPEAIKRARRFLAENFDGYADLRWHELYWCVTGNLDQAFIPSDIFHVLIEPALNAMNHALILTDKNVMYDLPIASLLPEPVLHIVGGDLYLPGFARVGDDQLGSIFGASRDEFIIKPSILHGSGINLRALDGASAARFSKGDFKRSSLATRRQLGYPATA